MSRTDELEERMLETMLEEIEGHGPDIEWIVRSATQRKPPKAMTAADGETVEPAALAARRSRPLLVAASLVAGVLTTLFVWSRTMGGEAPHRSLGGARSTADEAPDARGSEQDPAERDPERWIEALRDESQVRDAVRALSRGGPSALRAMIAALGDEQAPRVLVLEALNAMGQEAGSALPVITRLVREGPDDDALLGALVRTGATLVPFVSEDQRHDLRRAVLVETCASTTPQPREFSAREFSARDVARLLHRAKVPADASANALLELLALDPSPFVRELAAYRLREHDGPDVRRALHDAIVGAHPTSIYAAWSLEDGRTGSIRCAEECDDIIGYTAARSLAAMAPQRPIAVRAHLAILRMGALAERRRSAFSLARIEIDARDLDDVADALATWLTDDDRAFLREMVVVAARLPLRTPEIRLELERLADHADRQIAEAAALALRAHR